MPSVHCDCIGDIVWSCDEKSYNQISPIPNVDIWRIRVSSSLNLISQFDQVLSRDERARACRYHQEKDRARFLVSRIALRGLLAKYSNRGPADIEFITGNNKKPLLNNSGSENLHYNISHSGDWILIAVGNSEVGADVEKQDKGFSYEAIIEQNFGEEEIQFIKNSREPSANFYLLWTRKEALLKATAKGIHDELKLVPCLNGDHQVDEKIIGSNRNWQVKTFQVNTGCFGSVAYKENNRALRFFDFDRVLL
jgi:4'-phosphopantetheinyl transferase